MISKMNSLQMAEAKENARNEIRTRIAKTLVETYCSPENFADLAIKSFTFLDPFDYEILDVEWVSLESKGAEFRGIKFPKVVIIRDCESEDIVMSFSISRANIDNILHKVTASTSGSKYFANALDQADDELAQNFIAYHPYRNLRNREIQFDLVFWEGSTDGTSWWRPARSTPIQTLDDFREAYAASPSDPARGFITQKAKGEAKSKSPKMQIKDIPDEPILEFLKELKGLERYATMSPDYGHSIQNSMPPGTPDKLARAKMKSLIKRGLVSGCACSCRGDFSLVDLSTE